MITTELEPQRITIPYKPRALQRHFHENMKRWNLLVCHRRYGKTVKIINQLIKDALSCTKHQPRFGYIAPFYSQAKQIAWDYLKYYSNVIPGVTFNEAELRADYPNGGRVRLYGADNPHILRGIYLDGVGIDEYGQIKPTLLAQVIRPALSDRQGYAIISGTPNGPNEFFDLYEKVKNNEDWYIAVHKASETGLIAPDELKAARDIMDEDTYNQEYECSFSASMKGAYYGKEIELAEIEGRIQELPYDPALPVYTTDDIGTGDMNVTWFFQVSGPWFNYIDYYEKSDEGVQHFVKHKKNQPFTYHTHYAPHDMNSRDYSGNGQTRKQIASALGINYEIVHRHSIEDRIDATRNHISKCRFDKVKCADGIKALKSYTKKWDDERKVYMNKPLHNWASHPADSFGYGVMGYKEDALPQSSGGRQSYRGSHGWMS